jgi:hypothetical protein
MSAADALGVSTLTLALSLLRLPDEMMLSFPSFVVPRSPGLLHIALRFNRIFSGSFLHRFLLLVHVLLGFSSIRNMSSATPLKIWPTLPQSNPAARI